MALSQLEGLGRPQTQVDSENVPAGQEILGSEVAPGAGRSLLIDLDPVGEVGGIRIVIQSPLRDHH
jgi:hypothetical protein